MADVDTGLELAREVLFGFGPGKILYKGGLDETEDQEQDDKNGDNGPEENAHQPAGKRSAGRTFGSWCSHKL